MVREKNTQKTENKGQSWRRYTREMVGVPWKTVTHLIPALTQNPGWSWKKIRILAESSECST